jgi:hypothetical protein
MALYKYNEFISLLEGGFSTTKTQETPITPQVIGKVNDVVQKLSSDFNSHLRELELPSLDFLRPIGSGTWWKEDIKNQPDKLYGDVDYMVAYPTLKLTDGKERDDEVATTKLYNQELLMWLEAEKYKGVDLLETKKVSSINGIKLIVEVELEGKTKGWVQVDLVMTHKEYAAWSLFRFTPMRNIKGFVLGNLYSSLGEVLDISIQARGVRAKFIGNQIVELSKRKDTEDKLISANIQTFMQDIAKLMWELSGSDKPLNTTAIESWKGMNLNNPRIEDLCEGIKLLAQTLDQLGEFGGTVKYKSANEFLNAVVNRYTLKMEKAAVAPKFDKAYSDLAIKAVNKIKSLVEEYVPLVKKLLK